MRALEWLQYHPLVIGPLLAGRFLRAHGRLPRLFAPETFNEKVLHRLLFDRRPVLTRLAGKLEVRDYALERTGDAGLTVPLVGSARDAAEFATLRLPPAFIMKPNHLSGYSHIHKGPQAPDIAALGATCAAWTARAGRTEWPYAGVRRTVVIEPLMLDEGRVPCDYKLYCYAGVPRFIQVSTGRFDPGGARYDLFLPDWTWLDWRIYARNAEVRPERPALLEELVAVAARLSAGLDFVRVDLYAYGGRVLLGEMTTVPNRGTLWLDPPEVDAILGAPWVPAGRG